MDDFFGTIHDILAWPLQAIHWVLAELWDLLFGWI